jgi:fructokinase
MLTQPIAIFGEVLVDCFEHGERVLGGAPFNVAWHLQAFNQAAHFISRVGDDDNGRAIIEAMQAWGMSDSALQRDSVYPTGVVQISVNQGQPSYAILPNQAYDFIDEQQLPREPYGLIYHGTLALRHAASSQAFKALTAQHSGKIFLDVNLRAPWWHKDTIESYLQQAHWLKLNDEELQVWQQPRESLNATMQRLISHYALDTLIVTLGERGAVALNQRGERFEIKPQSHSKVIDTVGAGDAFAAVLLLGLQQQWDLATSLQRAQQFASAIVGQRGAIGCDRDFYRDLSQQWGLL